MKFVSDTCRITNIYVIDADKMIVQLLTIPAAVTELG